MFGMPQWRDDGILLVGEIGIVADHGFETSCECCSHPSVIIDALSFGRWAVMMIPARQWREPSSSLIPE